MEFKRFFICTLLFLASQTVQAENYCMAIRGNGELMPAHWGAMAQTIESFGLPLAVSGGSSASISSFLLESIVLNPQVQTSSGSEQALIASFLIKSMQGYTYVLADNPQWKTLFEFSKMISGQSTAGAGSSLQKLIQAVSATSAQLSPQNLEELTTAFKDINNSQVFSGPAIAKLFYALQVARAQATSENVLNLKAQLVQVKNSFAVFGKFDAKDDQALFLRDGVVNFNALARLFGKMAAFYSLKDASAATQNNIKIFTAKCATNSQGKSWSQIIAANPSCQSDLALIVKNYFANEGPNSTRIYEQIGSGIHALITTSVVNGDSRASLRAQKEKFDRTQDVSLGQHVDVNPQDLRFGYWGLAADLQRVESGLSSGPFNSLAKSKKFLNLGAATWELALSNSPAEPGLSSFNIFNDANGNELLSLGGWSDLHPIPALKALGCEKVIYLTRKGGDSLFSQGVAKRLLQLDDNSIPWAHLDSSKSSQVLNDSGNPDDQTSTWSSMYNLANPNSSYAGSLKAADGVVCTNWNDFDIKKDFTRMIDDSYAAPIFLSSPIALTGLKPPIKIKAEDNLRDTSGAPVYAGCIPLH